MELGSRRAGAKGHAGRLRALFGGQRLHSQTFDCGDVGPPAPLSAPAVPASAAASNFQRYVELVALSLL